MTGSRPLRSRAWFDNPDNPDMTALYLERYLNYGLTRRELQSGKPIIGIAQTGSDLSPCNRHHLVLAERVREGIREAGGIAMEFPVHPIQETGKRPTAGLDRNLAYLGLVESLYGYPLDGVVLTIGCDKTTPACLMAAATVDMPAIALSVGPMLNGWHKGERTGSGTIIWKARQMLAAGEIDYDGFLELVASSAPSVGYCNTMGTATTMNSLAEALGMAESSVKRMLAKGDMPLSRIDAICRALALDFADLARRVADEQPLLKELTQEQEKAVVKDKKLLLVAICTLSQWTLEQIIGAYRLTKAECIGYLVQLDRIGIIELRPLNRYRLKLAKTFRWRPHGPVMEFFRDHVVLDYYAGGFNGPGEGLLLVHGEIGRSLAPVSRVRRQVAARQADDLSPVSEDELPDEVRPLVHELNLLRVQLFKALVRAENLRYSVAEFWSQTLELLAQRITGNAGKTGEHYITSSRGEYFQMLRSAMGAGFIVAFMAMLKLWMGGSEHSPLGTALLYSLNYGLGFVLIFMLHFTIATKQPAMTASYLAQALSGNDKGRDRLDDLVELIVRTIRSQLIAIVGNVLPAFTIAALLGTLVLAQTGGHYISPDKARQLLDDQSPVASLALFHAAIAGVCLFLAGLISGYFDNKAVYDRIPQRLRQLHSLRRRLGEERLERLAQYIENHLGGLAGNFFFGCMLGSMGTLGFILGLPLDIRHITFSTAYFGFAAAALDWQLGARLMAITALGVLAIGIVNLTVSFGLALYVALRAQRVAFSDTRRLLGKLLRRFLRGPQDFFWPPRDRSVSESAASG